MKKSIIKNIYKPFVLLFAVLMPVLATAQEFDEGDGDGDDVDDEIPAPINGYVAAALVAGCAAGYVLLKRDSKLS